MSAVCKYEQSSIGKPLDLTVGKTEMELDVLCQDTSGASIVSDRSESHSLVTLSGHKSGVIWGLCKEKGQ